jgi:hypothetical protein
LPIAGIGFVVVAGIGAERTGARPRLTGQDHPAVRVQDEPLRANLGAVIRPAEPGAADA